MTQNSSSCRYNFNFTWLIVTLVAALGPAIPTVRGIGWSSTVQISALHNDNVNQAIREQTDDAALEAALGVHKLHIINSDWQVSIGGNLQSSVWDKYSGLNMTELGVNATIRRKFGLGPYAPRIELDAEVAHQISNVDEWSGNWLRISAQLHKRFTPSWQASLTGEYAKLDAERDVYSTINTSVTGLLDYDITPEWRVSLSLLYSYGDKLFWCRNRWFPFKGTKQWKDGIFGEDWFPYQATGNTKSAGVTIARALGPDSTISVSYDASKIYTSPKHTYNQHILSLNFIHSF